MQCLASMRRQIIQTNAAAFWSAPSNRISSKSPKFIRAKIYTSGNPAKSFEVDPKLRFDVMREAQSRNDGVDIIGHYHSHPDGPAAPSAKDLSMAYEPNMVWLICRVAPNEEVTIGAFQPCSDRSAFNTLELVIN